MNNAALSAVKRRRAAFQPQTSIQSSSQQQSTTQFNSQTNSPQQDMQNIAESLAQPRSLALKDVIYLFDSRILYLEKTILDIKTGGSLGISQPPVQELVKQSIQEHIDEFDHRYEMLAGEIVELKDAFMKLQTFAMDINKSLEEMDEQIRILIEGPNEEEEVEDEVNSKPVEENITTIME